MQIKTSYYRLTGIRKLRINLIIIRDISGYEPLSIAGKNTDWCMLSGEQFGTSRNKYMYHMTQKFKTWVNTQKKFSQGTWRLGQSCSSQPSNDARVSYSLCNQWKRQLSFSHPGRKPPKRSVYPQQNPTHKRLKDGLFWLELRVQCHPQSPLKNSYMFPIEVGT